MINRLFRQFAAFDEILMTCDRCERDVPLALLSPCANITYGFICNFCLTTMPYTEFTYLRERSR